LVVKLKNDKKDSFFKSKIKNPGQTAQGFKNSKIFLKNDPLNGHLKGRFIFLDFESLPVTKFSRLPHIPLLHWSNVAHDSRINFGAYSFISAFFTSISLLFFPKTHIGISRFYFLIAINTMSISWH
jgi:hypothetical protein